jgi:hypothetical protein
MYLTDDREKTVYDIITQVEPDLFEKVTSLSLKDFGRLVDAGAFNASKMNDAVWKFRQFEEPSLSYTKPVDTQTRGGWNVRRDERFAELIEKAIVSPGDVLTNSDPINPVTAVVSEDFGVIVDGVRHESPDLAAIAASGAADVDGWSYWSLQRDGKVVATLLALRDS